MPVDPADFGVVGFAFPVVSGGGAADYPADGDVEAGVVFASGLRTGTFAVPPAGDVREGRGYGADGVELVGTLVAPHGAASSAAMTDIEASVFAQLAGYSPLVALVGDKVYPSESDWDAPRPVVTYSRDSSEPMRQLSGAAAFVTHTFTVTADSINKDSAMAIASAAKDALDRQTFGVCRRAYWADQSTTETDDGYQVSQTFTVIQ